MTVDLKNIVRMDSIRQPVTVSFRGCEYELPSRDAELLDRLISAEKLMSEAVTGREKAEALKQENYIPTSCTPTLTKCSASILS